MVPSRATWIGPAAFAIASLAFVAVREGVAARHAERSQLPRDRFALAFLRGFPMANEVVVADPRRPARTLVRSGARVRNVNWARGGTTLLLETTRSPYRFEVMPNGTVRARDDRDARCISSPDPAKDGTRLECGGTSATLLRPGARPRYLPETEGDNVFRGGWTLSPDGRFYADVVLAATDPAPQSVEVVSTRASRGGGSASAPSEFWTKSDLSWSPDGQRLAYSAMREPDLTRSDPGYDPFRNGADDAVIVIRADGRVLARIPNAARPAWSPDGRKLAFDSDRGGRRQIYVADANGGNARQLTRGSRASWRVRWRVLR